MPIREFTCPNCEAFQEAILKRDENTIECCVCGHKIEDVGAVTKPSVVAVSPTWSPNYAEPIQADAKNKEEYFEVFKKHQNLVKATIPKPRPFDGNEKLPGGIVVAPEPSIPR